MIVPLVVGQVLVSRLAKMHKRSPDQDCSIHYVQHPASIKISPLVRTEPSGLSGGRIQ